MRKASPKYIALLRGINVGGHNLVPMARLKSIFQACDFEEVQTYLQSGNVVFQPGSRIDERLLVEKITARLDEAFPFQIKFVLRTAKELSRVISRNPFATRTGIAKEHLHVVFLANPVATIETSVLPTAKGEQVIFDGDTIYLHLPFGSGRSKVNNNWFEKTCGVTATTRNWNTVRALERLACSGYDAA
ncbi:MAG: DUF1697 domain-containing protein [Verrucomicrobiota bacterium]